MTLHIYAPEPETVELMEKDCPTCQGPQSFLVTYTTWLGCDMTCLNCGDNWQDGEMRERPFRRGWREQSIKAAKEKLAKLGIDKSS